MKYNKVQQAISISIVFFFLALFAACNCHNQTNKQANTATPPCDNNMPPSITVIYPNGGETFHVGDTINITWTSCNVQNVSLNLGIGGHDRGTFSEPDVPAAQGTYQYIIPEPFENSHNNYWIGISQREAPSLIAKSGEFSIL